MLRISIGGFSLLEVLICLALSLGCMGCILSVYLASQKGLNIQLSLQNEVRNAQLAIDILKRDIHLAGYIGCAKLTDDFLFYSHLPYSLSPKNKLFGGDHDLTVMHADESYVSVIAQQDNTVLTSDEVHFKLHDIVLISDCEKAELVSIDQVYSSDNHQALRFLSPLKFKFDNNAQISKWMVNHYFVERDDQASDQGYPTYVLYKHTIQGEKQMLVDGISNLSFHYTADQDGQLTDEVAEDVIDWGNVKGVAGDLTVQEGKQITAWQMYAAV